MVRGHAGLTARAHRLQGVPGHPTDGPVRRGGAGATTGGACGCTRSVVQVKNRKPAARGDAPMACDAAPSMQAMHAYGYLVNFC